VANFVTHAPGLSRLAKWAAGYDQRRTIPRFAEETFKHWWRRRPVLNDGSPRVLLWADTFTNYFQPEIAKAAVEALEDAGCQVEVAEQDLCCGRPLYDYGMLELARRKLRQILEALRPQIEAGRPVVVLEPSCATVFREEMPNLLGSDTDAGRLKDQVFLLSEFLMKKVQDYTPPRLHRKVYVHGHCHQKAVLGMRDENDLLDKLGADRREIESGCCGMAGAFGYEAGEHYRVSIACGERALLPAVRGAEPEAVIVSDGFSCREQIEQQTERRALHLAQVVQMALDRRDGFPEPGAYPECAYPAARPAARAGARSLLAAIAAGAVAAGAALWLLAGRRR